MKPLTKYLPHRVDIYKKTTNPKGHIEVSGTRVYKQIPCYVWNVSSTWINKILGMTSAGRYNVIFKKTWQGEAIEIYENHIIMWTEGRKTRRLMVTDAFISKNHIKVETEEIL